MSEGVKIALIVGGSAVGVFLLLKAMQPSSAAAKPARAPTDTISLNSLIGIGTSIAGFFKGSGGSSSNEPTQADLDRIGFDTGNYTSSDGFTFTDSSGTFIAG